MNTKDKIIVISMLAVAIAIILFLIYQFFAFYHYKSIVLDRFPVEEPAKEEKRFFEEEMEKKQQAVELVKRYIRGKTDLYGEIQNMIDKIKGDVNIIGWKAEKAVHVGQLYDKEKHDRRLIEDFKNIMEKIKSSLLKLKNLGFLIEGSPASELLIEKDPKYFSQRIKKLKDEFVSIQFYLAPRGKGMIKAKDLSDEAKKLVDEIDKEVEKVTGIMKNFYQYEDNLYLVSFQYQTEQDRAKNKVQGWYFEVDLDSKIVRDVTLDKDLSRKYQVSYKLK